MSQHRYKPLNYVGVSEELTASIIKVNKLIHSRICYLLTLNSLYCQKCLEDRLRVSFMLGRIIIWL